MQSQENSHNWLPAIAAIFSAGVAVVSAYLSFRIQSSGIAKDNEIADNKRLLESYKKKIGRLMDSHFVMLLRESEYLKRRPLKLTDRAYKAKVTRIISNSSEYPKGVRPLSKIDIERYRRDMSNQI